MGDVRSQSCSDCRKVRAICQQLPSNGVLLASEVGGNNLGPKLLQEQLCMFL